MWMNARLIALDVHCNDLDHNVFCHSRQMLAPYPQETVAHFCRRLFSLLLVLPWLYQRQAQQRSNLTNHHLKNQHLKHQHSKNQYSKVMSFEAVASEFSECSQAWQLQIAHDWPSHLQPDIGIAHLHCGEYWLDYWIGVDMPTSPRLKQLLHRQQQPLLLQVIDEPEIQVSKHAANQTTSQTINPTWHSHDVSHDGQAVALDLRCGRKSAKASAKLQQSQCYRVYQISNDVLVELTQCLARRMHVFITQQDAELDICIGDCQLHVPALDQVLS